MTWATELRQSALRTSCGAMSCWVRGQLGPPFHPDMCSRFRGQLAAPALKVEKVRKPLKPFTIFGCKSGSSLIISSYFSHYFL